MSVKPGDDQTVIAESASLGLKPIDLLMTRASQMVSRSVSRSAAHLPDDLATGTKTVASATAADFHAHGAAAASPSPAAGTNRTCPQTSAIATSVIRAAIATTAIRTTARGSAPTRKATAATAAPTAPVLREHQVRLAGSLRARSIRDRTGVRCR